MLESFEGLIEGGRVWMVWIWLQSAKGSKHIFNFEIKICFFFFFFLNYKFLRHNCETLVLKKFNTREDIMLFQIILKVVVFKTSKLVIF